MIDAAHERARPAGGPGFADAVTYSFADIGAGLFGLARIGLSDRGASALAIVFSGREPLGALAKGEIEVSGEPDWANLTAGALSTTIAAPLERWTVTWQGDDVGFDLEFEASSAPAEVPSEDPVVTLGGLEGYEQLCRVSGRVVAGGRSLPVDGLGQRGHSWGRTDWAELDSARTVSAWLGEQNGGIALTSLRPAGARGHDEEAVWATLVHGGDPLPVDEARLSTTYDGDGHQRRAGLELWVGPEDDIPLRAAGEVLCGSTLELGDLRLELAFMRWHAEGADGVGRYDVLRRS